MSTLPVSPKLCSKVPNYLYPANLLQVRTQSGADVRTNIAAIYGPSVAKELIPFETNDQVYSK